MDEPTRGRVFEPFFSTKERGHMPDIDGAEVLQRLRASGSHVPVIVSSGYLDVSVERRLSQGEFQGFLAKPYAASDLAAAIERALGK